MDDNNFCKNKVLDGFQYCGSEVYKDGMCQKHYNKWLKKSMPYSHREGYRTPTEDEFLKGKLIYYKIQGSHGGYNYRNGIMYCFATGKPTLLSVDRNMYVIKNN